MNYLGKPQLKWQTMDTAPRDGSYVLLVFENGDVVMAANFDRQQADESQINPQITPHNGWWTKDGLDFDYGSADPVGWLPRSSLPPAPSTREEAADS